MMVFSEEILDEAVYMVSDTGFLHIWELERKYEYKVFRKDKDVEFSGEFSKEALDESGIQLFNHLAKAAEFTFEKIGIYNPTLRKVGVTSLREFRKSSVYGRFPGEDLPKDDIRFIDSRYNELFRISNGGTIAVLDSSLKTQIGMCEYIDEYHTYINGTCYHVCQWGEKMEEIGSICKPEEQPRSTDTKSIWRIGLWQKKTYLTLERIEDGWNYLLEDGEHGTKETGEVLNLDMIEAREQILLAHNMQHRTRERITHIF